MPSMKAGRVTRSASVLPSWQSMQATGWVTSLDASPYGIALIFSKPLVMSPLPARL
jgi:hypothetical protein